VERERREREKARRWQSWGRPSLAAAAGGEGGKDREEEEEAAEAARWRVGLLDNWLVVFGRSDKWGAAFSVLAFGVAYSILFS
jgi:hypothetical protein